MENNLFRRMLLIGILGMSINAVYGTDWNVSNTSGLLNAMQNASGGDTIICAGGEYTQLVADDIHPTSMVVIIAEDREDPPVFTGNPTMILTELTNFTFDGLSFDGTDHTDVEDYPSGIAVRYGLLESVTFRNCSFDFWHMGFTSSEGSNTVSNTDIIFEYNKLTRRGMDWWRFFKPHDGLIIRNNLSENDFIDTTRSHQSTRHPDITHFAVNSGVHGSSNVLIEQNKFVLHDHYSHCIFMGNQIVSDNEDPDDDFYHDVTVQKNLLIAPHANTVGFKAVKNIDVNGNRIISAPPNAYGGPSGTPRINAYGYSTGSITNNTGPGPTIPSAQPGTPGLENITISGNVADEEESPTGWVDPTPFVGPYAYEIDEFIIQDTLEIIAEADAFVRAGAYETTNYGSANYLNMKSAGPSSDYTRETYIRFDLGDVEGTITGATLQLNATQVDAGATVELDVIEENTWVESTITWNNSSSFTSLGEVAEWDPSEGTNMVPLDTVLLQDAVGSKLTLKGVVQENLLVGLSSKEAGNSSYHPRLIVYFETSGTVPAAPSNLNVSDIQTDELTLTWEDNASDEEGFLLERRQLPSGSFVVVADDLVANTESYEDSGLDSGTGYEYRLSAFNAIGNSDPVLVETATLPVMVKDTLAITAEADAFVRAGAYSSTNYGGATYLNMRSSGPSNDYTREIYMRFDLEDVEGTITGATLQVNTTQTAAGATVELEVIEENSWVENTITWSSASSFTSLGELAEWDPVVGNNLVPLDTALLQDLVGDKLTLKGVVQENLLVGFSSKEAGNSSYHPQLIVYYEYEGDPGARVAGAASNEVDILNDNTESVIAIYPNPVERFLKLEGLDPQEEYQLRLQDLSGKIFIEKEKLKGGDFQLDVSELSNGIYLMEVRSRDRSVIIRVVKN